MAFLMQFNLTIAAAAASIIEKKLKATKRNLGQLLSCYYYYSCLALESSFTT